ncbi:hypothetical protein GJ496_001658 [Pomphorhynchus laevis]|nr:hypothetical protein GJ496_001658 [Pomphorhynchus laevis]
MRRSATVRTENKCLGRALLKDNNYAEKRCIVDPSDHDACHIQKKTKTVIPITQPEDNENNSVESISTTDLIKRLNESSKQYLINRNYFALLHRFTGTEDEILMALSCNANRLSDDTCRKQVIDYITQTLAVHMDINRFSLLISSICINDDLIFNDLIKFAFRETSHTILASLLRQNRRKSVVSLIKMISDQNGSLEFWFTLADHLMHINDLVQDQRFLDYVFKSYLTVNLRGFVVALCFGKYGRKSLNGFSWIKDQLLRSSKCTFATSQSINKIPRLIESLFDSMNILNIVTDINASKTSGLESVVKALPEQCVGFILFMLNDNNYTVNSASKIVFFKSQCTLVYEFLITLLDILLAGDNHSNGLISSIVNAAFKSNYSALEILCKILTSRKIVGQIKQDLENNLLPKFNCLHLLPSSTDLMNNLPHLLRISSRARYELFQCLLIYSYSPKTVCITMTGLIMLLGNERLASASLLAQCTSQASQMVAMSQPATQRHLLICATGLDLLRRNIKHVQDQLHILVRQNRNAISVPILAMLTDHLLSQNETDKQDLYACCIRCIAECILDLYKEDNRNQIIYYRDKLMEILKVQLKSEETSKHSSFLIEYHVLLNELKSTPTDEFIDINVTEADFVSELATNCVYQTVINAKCNYPGSFARNTLLKNIKWPEIRKNLCKDSIRNLSQQDICNNWKWWLKAGNICKTEPPPSKLTEIGEILQDFDSIRYTVEWALAFFKSIDPISAWTSFVDNVLFRMLSDFKINQHKVLEIVLDLHLAIATNPLDSIKKHAQLIKPLANDSFIETLSRSVSKLLHLLTDQCELLCKFDDRFSISFSPIIEMVCYICEQSFQSVKVCQKVAILLNLVYQFLIEFVKLQNSFDVKFIDSFLALLGKDALQKATTVFINQAQTLDNQYYSSSKKVKSNLATLVPKLVQNSDEIEYMLLAKLKTSDTMKRHFKLTACRDFRIDRREFEIIKSKRVAQIKDDPQTSPPLDNN